MAGKKNSPDVVVIIPAFNEEKTIEKAIVNVNKELLDFKHQVIVVDDGSTDSTVTKAKKSGAKVISHPRNRGLARAFRTGVKEALKLKPNVLVNFDADLQYDARQIPVLVREVLRGNDLVLASRFSGTIEEMPLVKKVGNLLFSKVISQITGTRISDSQTGFRAFNVCVAKLKLISNYTYTQEQIIRALRNEFRIKEVPTHFRKRHGKSRLISSPLNYAVRAGVNLVRVYRDFAPLKFFGFIGLFLFFIGLIFGAYLTFLHFTGGIFGHLALIILTALLILIGIQIVLFGFLADIKSGN